MYAEYPTRQSIHAVCRSRKLDLCRECFMYRGSGVSCMYRSVSALVIGGASDQSWSLVPRTQGQSSPITTRTGRADAGSRAKVVVSFVDVSYAQHEAICQTHVMKFLRVLRISDWWRREIEVKRRSDRHDTRRISRMIARWRSDHRGIERD